jgi:phospholipid/cholesterol/gamma-HCH transport system substrate-binding protein
MPSRAQRVRVGAFLLAIAGLALIVVLAFGGMELRKHHTRYYVVFSSSVFGLDDGSLVYMNGVHVGQVVGLAFDRADLSKVIVTIEVARDTPVRTDTTADLPLAGLTGLKVIELHGGSASAPELPDGGTMVARPSSLDKLAATADHLADEADKIADKANRVLDNLVEITDPERIDPTIADVRQAAVDLAAASASARAMIDEDRGVVHDTLVAARDTARSAHALVDGPVAQASGDAGEIIATLRGLVQANAGPIQAAVGDLRRASKSLAELARELRERPSRLLFSRAPPARKLP